MSRPRQLAAPVDDARQIAWINASALANEVSRSNVRRGSWTPQHAWHNSRESFAAMFAEGPAHLEQDADETRIRWANGLAFIDPPRGSYRLAAMPLTDRERQLVALKLASPHRAAAGCIVVDQADAGHLPLFIAANEPRLF